MECHLGLIAETLVEEWLNSKGFFTIRGLKKGVDEIDLLGIQSKNSSPKYVHYEVQVSYNPVAYITGNNSAKKRTLDELVISTEEWIEKKFKSDKKSLMRSNLYGETEDVNWEFCLVHGVVRHQEELLEIKKHINTIFIGDIISDLQNNKEIKTGNLGREITDLIGIYQDNIVSKDITGRDNQIISEALKLAIPMMVKHSLSASNTEDMIKILNEKFNNYSSTPLDNSIQNALMKMISDILKDDIHASDKKSDYMENAKDKLLTFEYVKKLVRHLSSQYK